MSGNNAKIQLVGLNLKWWTNACDTCRENFDALTPFEREFVTRVIGLQADCAGLELDFHPTVKQFNFMRQLAEKVR